MKPLSWMVAVAVAALSLTAPRFAFGAGELREACKDDVAKLCKGIQPGKGRVWACLRGAEDKVSSGCKAAIVSAKGKMEKFHADCKADLDTYCKDVPAGRGRKLACLKGAKDKLKPACKTHVEQADMHPEHED